MGKDCFSTNYKICMKGKHCGLKVTSCGMFVSVNGLFGASPDGLVSCTCHGTWCFGD